MVVFTVPADAEGCPGNPNAIGTFRTLVVDPREHPRVGTMQYPETLPLRDHEVVLTFDDGPLPPHSSQVLDILASQCVKATFFLIGRMAKEFPEGVRRVYNAGHTIGTHTQNHPLSLSRMPFERAKQEIEDGIASVKAALGDNEEIAPFFRVPGLLRSPELEDYLASRGLMVWSADFPADDWRHIPASRVSSLALSRLEAKGKGILLLHDIQARTVAALPNILRELKARGFHIVHVVPASPDRPRTPTEPGDWQLHPSDISAVAKWPSASSFAFSGKETMAVAELAGLGIVDDTGRLLPGRTPEMPKRRVPLPPEPIWPRKVSLPAKMPSATLAIPSEELFRIGTVSGELDQILPGRAEGQTPAIDSASRIGAARNRGNPGHALPGSWPIRESGFSRH